MEIHLPDGTVLQAPDDADPSVVAKGYLAKQAQPQPTATPHDDSIARQVALTGRNIGEGVIGTALGAAERFGKFATGQQAVDSAVESQSGKTPFQLEIEKFNADHGTSLPAARDLTDMFSQLLTKAGAPVPETKGERMAAATEKGAASALAMPATGASALLTAASGASSGAAGEYVREKGGGPVAQFLASVAGGVAPGLLKAGVTAGTKAVLRAGATPEEVQANIDSFKAAGTTPSAGQATEAGPLRAAESLLSKAPGSSGVMAGKAEEQAAQLGAGVEKTAATLAPKSSSEQAGRAITQGVSGEGGFTEQFKAQQEKLFDKLDNFIPQDKRVDLTATKDALSKLNAGVPGAPNVSRFFQNAKLKSIEGALNEDLALPTNEKVSLDEALQNLDDLYQSRNSAVQDMGRFQAFSKTQANKTDSFYPVTGQPRFPGRYSPFPQRAAEGTSAAADAAAIAKERVGQAQSLEGTIGQLQQAAEATGGKLPYEAVKKLRTLVGREISDAGLMSDVPRNKWKALYGALSSDMEAAAADAGPNATQAFARANNYTRAGMRRLETIQSVIDKNGGPESVFQAATSGTKEGATTLRAVMQSLPEDAQKTVSATVLRRLGRAKSGVQNDLGDQFSTETFLTNWNGLAPEAKAVLFNRYGPDFRANMDQIAKVASNLRDGSKVFKNPAGTASAAANMGAIGAFFGSLFSGHLPVAAGIGAAAGGANVTARLLTYPPFVSWLAKSTRMPLEAAPGMLAGLAQSKDPVLRSAAAVLQQPAENQQDGNNQSTQ